MDLFKSKGIKVFLASHTHSAQLIMHKHTKAGKKWAPFTSPCASKESKPLPGQCRYVDPAAFTSATNPWTIHTTCDAKVEATTDAAPTTYALETAGMKSDYMFIFVVGNSGRNFDPVKSDALNTTGALVWGRSRIEGNDFGDSTKIHFGFATADFDGEVATIKYHEVSPATTELPAGKFTTVAQFTITRVTEKKTYANLDTYLATGKAGQCLTAKKRFMKK
jgi:hypothetical protein